MSLLLLLALAAGQSPDSISRYLSEHQRPALDALVEAAQAHPIVLLGDVHPASAPKRLVAELIGALYSRDLLDAVALEVPMTQQPAIREYLASEPEDLDILLAHPLLLRAHWGESQEYLDIYRTVWALNQTAPTGRTLQLLAIDTPRGPPAASSRRAALERYVGRDAVMELQIRRWREANAGGRIIVFVGDIHTLKGVEANLDVDGEFGRLVPLATRLDRLWPGEVVTAFSDAAVPGHEGGASRLYPYAEAVLTDIEAAVAVPSGEPGPGGPGGPGGPLDGVAAPVRLNPDGSLLTIQLLPKSYTLSRVTDLYIFFGMSGGLTPFERQERR